MASNFLHWEMQLKHMINKLLGKMVIDFAKHFNFQVPHIFRLQSQIWKKGGIQTFSAQK